MIVHPEQLIFFERRVIVEPRGRGWLDYRLAPGGTAEIVNIEVVGEHRRQGAGRMLLEMLLAELPNDVRRVFAFTRRSNLIARQWYAAMGFWGTVVADFYGDDSDAVLFSSEVP